MGNGRMLASAPRQLSIEEESPHSCDSSLLALPALGLDWVFHGSGQVELHGLVYKQDPLDQLTWDSSDLSHLNHTHSTDSLRWYTQDPDRPVGVPWLSSALSRFIQGSWTDAICGTHRRDRR